MTPTIAIREPEWTLPDRGRVGIICLIATELTLFTIFVVAYLFYIGKSVAGPTPSQVLELPVWPSICLLSSSITVTLATRALASGRLSGFRLWTGLTVLLGLEFLRQTAIEWRHLIVDFHLTITTNLFGTTFYSLVGLHAGHVVFGLSLLSLTLGLGAKMQGQARRFELLAWYWHFVDAVWVVVFTVVYVAGR